jgi:thymidylate kinase
MRPHFQNVIHIEGMDLAGKSTVTARLSERHGASITRNSLSTGNEIYALADEMRRKAETSPDVLGSLYVASLARDLELLAQPEGPAIQDSTILLRSSAYYCVLGRDDLVDAFGAMVGRHPRFGTSVILTASIDARRHRLDQRRRLNPAEVAPDDLAIERDPARFLRMESALIEFAQTWFHASVIDTSDLDPAGVFERVMSLVPHVDG